MMRPPMSLWTSLRSWLSLASTRVIYFVFSFSLRVGEPHSLSRLCCSIASLFVDSLRLNEFFNRGETDPLILNLPSSCSESLSLRPILLFLLIYWAAYLLAYARAESFWRFYLLNIASTSLCAGDFYSSHCTSRVLLKLGRFSSFG